MGEWDLFGAVPFDGGDLTPPIAPDSFGLDWGFNSGPSGEFLAGRDGSVTAGQLRIQNGTNTLDAEIGFELWRNGAPTPGKFLVPAGGDGPFAMTGLPVAYLAGDRLALVPLTIATSGTLTAPRFGLALEDA